jgi:hypothetical protein
MEGREVEAHRVSTAVTTGVDAQPARSIIASAAAAPVAVERDPRERAVLRVPSLEVLQDRPVRREASKWLAPDARSALFEPINPPLVWSSAHVSVGLLLGTSRRV